ncbi:hypothetical protein Tco_0366592 [Tanacetum coccineum]
MAQENYVEGCSMQRPPLLEANGFCFWKIRLKTHIKSKDIDLWQGKQLGKNSEANMTLYNALSCKKYERDLQDDILTQQYEEGLNSEVSNLLIVASHDSMLLAKVTAIEEAKDLATLPLDKLIGNLKVYQMILKNNGVASKTTKEKVKSLPLKLKSLGSKLVMIVIIKEEVMKKKKPRSSI